MCCSKYSHCRLVRELKLQSLRRKDILQLQSFQSETSAKINKNLKQLRLWKCLMLPAHESPVKHYSRAAMNGSKDNTSRLKWHFRGLHSVFGTQLDHPFGPLLLHYRHWHTFTDIYSKPHTLSMSNPTWWPLVICSSPALFALIIWKLHLLLPF